MKKFSRTEHIQNLLDKINVIQNCIKENTSNFTLDSISESLTFQTKENFQIRIRLYK